MQKGIVGEKDLASASDYNRSGKADLNNALIRNFALVCADLDKKLRTRIEV